MLCKSTIKCSMAFLAVVLGFSPAFLATPAGAVGQWNVGISGGKDGIEDFNVSIGQHYEVPEREVVVIRDRGLDEEEVPVVFHVARYAHVPPREVADLRCRGMSWMDITDHYRLSPEIYYVPVREEWDGARHGNRYGWYKNHRGPREWRRMRFADRDVVDQVNMKFISERYRCAPERVMRARAAGRRFVAIEQELRHEGRGRDDDGPRRGGRG
jgi:hypothetical protein